MRIIAGTYRGRILLTVPDLSIRPTTDRVKQTVFDILSNRIDLNGVNILDLFSGSGSLGLEAISRGAMSATFIEKSPKSLAVLQKNVDTLGCGGRCTMYQADVFWYLKNAHRPYDLIFADPPYKLESIGALPNAIFQSGVLRNGTYVFMEHSRESAIDLDETKYDILKKPFGQTTVLILQAKVPPAVNGEAR
ncbi:MAG: 16S rRNA (guanine(966)-N(2))-methyltransferase RsmD [Bacteroidota bacterium]